MEVILTNLSNKAFEESRFRLNASAKRFGIEKIRSYDFDDLRGTDFYVANREVLEQPRGIGYWLWKPYIILEALNDAPDDAIIVYCDAGIEIIAPLEPLYELCRTESPVLLFGNDDQQNSTWTKRDCFVLMNCDTAYYWKAPQCNAAFALFRKTPLAVQIVTEWLRYCQDVRMLTDQANTCGKRNLPDFVDHRHDQSILSLMQQQYRLPLYRVPSQFGNHYKHPAFRVAGEYNCLSQYRPIPVDHYALIPYYNSPYPQLLDHHRGAKKGAVKRHPASPLIVRAIRKRIIRLINTVSLWRES